MICWRDLIAVLFVSTRRHQRFLVFDLRDRRMTIMAGHVDKMHGGKEVGAVAMKDVRTGCICVAALLNVCTSVTGVPGSSG